MKSYEQSMKHWKKNVCTLWFVNKHSLPVFSDGDSIGIASKLTARVKKSGVFYASQQITAINNPTCAKVTSVLPLRRRAPLQSHHSVCLDRELMTNSQIVLNVASGRLSHRLTPTAKWVAFPVINLRLNYSRTRTECVSNLRFWRPSSGDVAETQPMSGQGVVRGSDRMIDVYLSNFCLLEANLKWSIITTAERRFNNSVYALRESRQANCLLFLIQHSSLIQILFTKLWYAFFL